VIKQERDKGEDTLTSLAAGSVAWTARTTDTQQNDEDEDDEYSNTQ